MMINVRVDAYEYEQLPYEGKERLIERTAIDIACKYIRENKIIKPIRYEAEDCDNKYHFLVPISITSSAFGDCEEDCTNDELYRYFMDVVTAVYERQEFTTRSKAKKDAQNIWDLIVKGIL